MSQKLSFSFESTFESDIAAVHLRQNHIIAPLWNFFSTCAVKSGCLGQKALLICMAIDLHSWQIDNLLSLSLQKMMLPDPGLVNSFDSKWKTKLRDGMGWKIYEISFQILAKAVPMIIIISGK